MQIFVKQVEGLQLPAKAHSDDAAYDIIATSEPHIEGERFERPLDNLSMWGRVAYIEYETNLYIAPVREQLKLPKGIYNEKLTWENLGIDYHTVFAPRSSIS